MKINRLKDYEKSSHLPIFQSSNRRGIALVLVLIILGALVLVATPFVFSMLLHERTGWQLTRGTQALFGADGAKNIAISRLYATNDYNERRLTVAPFNTPYYDTRDELRIDLRGSALNLSNTQGALAGVEIQDEQGKINLTTAPQNLIANINALIDRRVSDFKDFTTLYSVRENEWIYPQRIRNINNGYITVDNAAHYGSGARLRISKEGSKPLEVQAVWDQNGFTTNPQISGGYNGGFVDVEARHPVNVNTAPYETLVALFQGLRTSESYRATDAQGRPITRWRSHDITNGEAVQIARAIYGRASTGGAFADVPEVANVVAGIVLSPSSSDGINVGIGSVVTNLTDPTNVGLGGTGTMPVCVKSYDVLTANVISTINSPLGNRLTSRAYREVVAATPPQIMRWQLQSQYDFERFINGGSGYPFGNKVVTFPNNIFAVGVGAADKSLGGGAYIQIKPGEDNRGRAQYINSKEHFTDTIEGRKLGGSNIAKAWGEVFYPVGAEITAGGMEMWVRFDSSSAFSNAYLFDIRESDYENRISLQYTGGELVLTACDATLERSAAQVTVPFAPIPQTWYHIGAYWKSTHYGLLTLMVDGQVHPNARFSYTGEGGASPPDGYSNALRTQSLGGGYQIDRVTIGGATLSADFGINTTTSVNAPDDDKIDSDGDQTEKDPDITNHRDIGISDTITSIPVGSGGTADFPNDGYILIGQEVIYYGSKRSNAKSDWFDGCRRGELGTTAATHSNGSSVTLFSIKVSNNANYLDRSIIQIDDEWFGVVQKTGTNYFTGVVNNGSPSNFGRGYAGTQISFHFGGAKVIPVFNTSRTVAARGDKITIIDGNNNKERQTVRNAQGTLVAFYDNVGREYMIDGTHTRLLKWPSGELLSMSWLNTASPTFNIGGSGITATIDELKFFASPKGNFLSTQQLDDATTIVYMNNADAMSQSGGAVKIGDEIIGYAYYEHIYDQMRRHVGDKLLRCKRGYLNSPPSAHPAGERAFNLSFLPITALSSDADATGSFIPLSGSTQQSEGYLLIGSEVVGFTIGGSSPSMPVGKDGSTGLFRGRFGTRATPHRQYELVYEMPFRFWDTYKQGEFDNRMVYYQAGYSVPGAFLRNIFWQEQIPPFGDDTLEVRVQSRLDGFGEWTEPPSRQGPIYEFIDGAANNILSKYSDKGIEVRLLFQYKNGSFYPANGWKKSPRIYQLWAEYQRETKALFHSGE